MTRCYLGIDGGSTKTQAVILDATGRVLGTGIGGSSNFGYIGVEQATANIKVAVEQATVAGDLNRPPFDAAFLGLAGVVSETDRQVVRGMAQALNLAPAQQIGVDHDCRVALAGGLGGAPGIVQIIGTGTSCFGINAAGERWMAGGWGRLIADEGGGYWLGTQAMKAATAAYDRRGRPTLLHDMMLEALEITDIGQIMERLYGQQLPVAEIAALGPLVIDAARQGDNVAQDIIAAGMAEVARCVEAVATTLTFPADNLRVVCVGGITQAGKVILEPLKAAIHRRLPQCRIEQPLFNAAIGAGILAMQQHGQPITRSVLDNIATSRTERD